MKKTLSAKNPFGLNRYGFLYEILLNTGKGVHLDYGSNDGYVLKTLATSDIIDSGVGVDLNINAINSANNIPKNILLKHIIKNQKLPFKDKTFDTISILDVIEHVHNQKFVLLELNRVLKVGGKIILTVPRKHIFSFLDIGNFKFIFPKLHKIIYQLKYSKKKYHKRYVECENGLFGDIEKEKMWHQHFSKNELSALIKECDLTPIEFDGSGFFTRPLILLSIAIPFISSIVRKIQDIDYKIFERMNLFCVAEKL